MPSIVWSSWMLPSSLALPRMATMSRMLEGGTLPRDMYVSMIWKYAVRVSMLAARVAKSRTLESNFARSLDSNRLKLNFRQLATNKVNSVCDSSRSGRLFSVLHRYLKNGYG
ncbi:hypothetical protein OGATHE_001640 [Ogataea polymorpha]|uniref:Secreted protein n=1 Tax=Ogataea polymorpha TaxID=460523 RepID=A0A9P8PPP4_9ASCO|nr:hypothetical protein OGATHE_001640 [Ogataea polymorpha]